MNKTHKIIAAAALITLCIGSQAQTAGTKLIRLGATQISPQVTSGNMTAPSFNNTKTDVASDTQLGGGLTYMYTDNIAIDIPLAPHTQNLALWSAQKPAHDLIGSGLIWRAMPSNAAQAAHELFGVLRDFDTGGVRTIWIETPPNTSEWEGVRDRINRAAA